MNSTLSNDKNRYSFDKKNIFRYFYIGLIFLFCFLPLIFLLFNISGNDLSYIFNDRNFHSAVGNSIFYSFIAALISTLLALIVAYYLSRSCVNKIFKKIIVLLFMLPMLVPTLSVGLGIRVLFGTNGLLDIMFNIRFEAIGFFGLIVGSAIVSFPPTFLILYDAFEYEDKAPYDAAEVMGIGKVSTFFHITLPFILKPLVTAFLACFTLIFADYGVPMELAGRVKTLPMYLYEQITASYSYGRGAFIGIILIIPALISFVIDLFIKDESRNEATMFKINSKAFFNVITIVVTSLAAIFLIIPEISFISLSFMKGYPNNISFSFDNIANIFNFTHGVGLIQYIKNSVIMSLLVGLFGVIFAYTLAYFSSRFKSRTGKILHFLAISTIAIPGIVLGVGYIFIFKNTKGFFYGTIAILVVVNIIHFLGSPYLMARNCFLKLNMDYETVGSTLGISKFKIFLKVLIPNSLPTLVKMFSYFFLNSMITISAVAFLFTYANEPLSILITTFEKTGNYEMQSVVSLIILIINLLFKGILSIVGFLINKKIKNKENYFMELSRHQFNLLAYLEKNGKKHYSQRYLADVLTLSLGTINKLIKELSDLDYVAFDTEDNLCITEKGLKSLEPYRVKRAIILAAGFGSRLAPVTLDTPKPLVKVKGVRIIDTLLDALIAKGIDNIIIVRGYKKEQFDCLLEKYPTIRFVNNDEYNVTNNISSLHKVLDYIDCCYICEADLFITNPDIISKYEYTTCYMGARVEETDDWCFKKSNRYITNYGMGGEDCYQAYGISYWNEKDSKQLRADIEKIYNSRAGKECFWDNVPLIKCKKNYKVEIKKCHKSDIIEIDNFSELVVCDESYKNYKDSDKY